MMRTQNQAEHGVIQSSIALLQERFKQLQRVKEMREKKELLRLFSEYQNNSPTSSHTYIVDSSTSHNNTSTITNDDDLQIFLPPNYYYNSRKPSSYSSSPSSSPSSSSSSSSSSSPPLFLSHNLNEISLSLWPAAISSYNNNNNATNNVKGGHCRRASLEGPLSTSSFLFEDSQHVSDVDTTLHL